MLPAPDFPVIMRFATSVRDQPSVAGTRLGRVERGDTLKPVDYEKGHWVIATEGGLGYVGGRYVERTPAVRRFVEERSRQKIRREREARESSGSQRRVADAQRYIRAVSFGAGFGRGEFANPESGFASLILGGVLGVSSLFARRPPCRPGHDRRGLRVTGIRA